MDILNFEACNYSFISNLVFINCGKEGKECSDDYMSSKGYTRWIIAVY